MEVSYANAPNRYDSGDIAQKILRAVHLCEPRIVLGEDEKQLSLEEAIGRLSDTDVGPLFESILSLIQGQLVDSKGDRERSEVKHKVRKLFGVRYSCLLLTSLSARQEPTGNEARSYLQIARRAAEEALQWHEDAVLAHTLIYYDDGDTEYLNHECGVAIANESKRIAICTALDEFRRRLASYVRDCGSSVRTKEHLRLASLKRSGVDRSLITRPLPSPKVVEMYSDVLQLPPRRNSAPGDQRVYSEIVRETMGKALELLDDYEYIHYSAGSDAIARSDVRATAHLYVIFRRKKAETIATDYALAMRETLARMTMDFALYRMQSANKKLSEVRANEERDRRAFEMEVRSLSQSIRSLQGQADKVIGLLTPSVWQCLLDWFPVIERLSSNKDPVPVKIGSRFATSPDHDWKMGQWAMALLKLVNAVEGDFARCKGTTAVAAWRFLSDKVRMSGSKGGIHVHPIWRCLDRMGVPFGSRFTSTSIAEFYPNCHELRLAFIEAEKNWGTFRKNGFTIAFLFFALGARFDRNSFGNRPNEEVCLIPELNTVAILDGLNLLHDVVNDRGFGGARDVGITIEKGTPSRILLELEAPKGLSDFGFQSLCAKMLHVKDTSSQSHPGWALRGNGMPLFAALGLNEVTWKDSISRLHIVPSEGLVELRDLHGKSIASCKRTEIGLCMSYEMLQGDSK